MSSKFSRASKVQKPPAICKKAPVRMDEPNPTHRGWAPSGLLIYDDWVFSDRVKYAAEFRFTTWENPFYWRTDLQGERFMFRVWLMCWEEEKIDRFYCHVYENDVLLVNKMTPTFTCRSWSPYDSGLQFAYNSTIPQAIRFRAMS